MTLTPELLAEAVRRGDAFEVRRLLAGAGEAERKACRPAVEAVRREQPSRFSVEAFHVGTRRPGLWPALVLAGVGVDGGAAALATLLRREEATWSRHPDLVVGVLVDRSPPWLPDLLARLADQPSDWATTTTWELVEELRLAAGLPRPTGAPYLRETAGRLTYRSGRRREQLPDLEGALRADASLRAVVPDLLRVPDVGEMLRARDTDGVRDPETGRWKPVPRPSRETWAGVLAALAGEGLLDRHQLLDHALGALLRDGKREHHSWFVAFLGALAPTAEEVVARVRSYVGVLADGSGSAATAAQKALRAADDAGRLELETVLDASRAALARPEKGVAVAQLGWLERAAKRRPGAVGELALVAADAVGHERRDVAERGLHSLERLARIAPLPADVLEVLRERAADLPDALLPRAAAVLGEPEPAVLGEPATDRAGTADRTGTATGTASHADPVGLLVPTAAPTAPRLRDVHELAEATAAYLESRDPLAAEGLLDALAALAARDRGALAAALEPLAGRLPAPPGERTSLAELAQAPPLAAALRRLLTPAVPSPPGLARRLLRHAAPPRFPWSGPPGPENAFAGRLAEVLQHVDAGESRRLLAHPATRTGATDPEEVVAAVAGMAAEGELPWRRDLEQAWLRLPRACVERPDPRLLDALAHTPGPAAAWLRQRLLTGPAPDPVVDVIRLPQTVQRWGHELALPLGGAPVAALDSPVWASPASDSLTERVLAQPDLPLRASTAWWDSQREDPLAALLTLPSHREVAAAHAVARLVDTDHRPVPGTTDVLALLPLADGPTGPATHLALAYAASSADVTARTAAGDALDGFALRGGLDAAAAGAVLGDVLLLDAVKLGRVAGVLGEVARGPLPARRLVWALLAAALPAVLPSGRRGVAELVTVAADTAAAVGARGLLPGLEAAATRSGSSRLTSESRRLRTVLAA